MELKIRQSELNSILSVVQNIVEKRNTMPILSNVLLSASDDCLKASATDLEITAAVEGTAEIIKPGSTTVNARVLYDIVKELPDEEVHIKLTEGERIEVSSGKSRMRIIGVSAEEYPSLPGLGLEIRSTMPAEQFSEMIGKTIYAVSADETRFNLSGVCFTRIEGEGGEKLLRMVATDGHRLAMITREVGGLDFNGGVLVPRKGLAEVRKLLDGTSGDTGVDIQEGFLALQTGLSGGRKARVSMRLIDGEFPDYKQVMPKGEGVRATIDGARFTSALRRVSLMVTDKTKGLRFDFTPGALKISSSSPELGDASEELEVAYDGDPLSVGFNSKYLLDITASLSENTPLVIELNGPLGPGKFLGEGDESYLAIVMPMRLV